MIIQIDVKTRLRVTDEYYAPMKREKSKKEKSGYLWREYMWFTSLPKTIKYLTQKRVSEKEGVYSLKKFLTLYKEIAADVHQIMTENGVT